MLSWPACSPNIPPLKRLLYDRWASLDTYQLMLKIFDDKSTARVAIHQATIQHLINYLQCVYIVGFCDAMVHWAFFENYLNIIYTYV